MAQYVISFNDGAMNFPEEELPDVANAARAVVQEAKDAGVFVFAGGLGDPRKSSVVITRGMISHGPDPETKDFIGRLTIVDVPTREEALRWASKIAVACRCAQEVRKFLRKPAPEAGRRRPPSWPRFDPGRIHAKWRSEDLSAESHARTMRQVPRS